MALFVAFRPVVGASSSELESLSKPARPFRLRDGAADLSVRELSPYERSLFILL